MFRANPNIQMTSMMSKNEAFVRCFRQIPRVEDVKMTLSCEASVKFQDLKIRRRSFRAMLPSNSTSSRCENEAFVRDFLQISTLRCSPLLSSTLFYCALLFSTLLYSTILCSTLISSALRSSPLLSADLLYRWTQ